ncbi:MAG TPA: S53 family peptidase [Terracidiphilus sp.]|nr:S53 family peptidase [Terracidiphilus sp.]
MLSLPPRRTCKPYFKLLAPETAPTAAWTVPDLCTAYGWPSNLAGGGVIALVELGGGWVQQDMDAFFESIGQPTPQITDVSVDGTQNTPNQNPGSDDDADYEVALDIQVAAAGYYLATGKAAVVRVYWAQDIAPAVEKATADGCDVCSISWGADEATWGTSAVQSMESAAQAAVNGGMAVFAASGDNDSSDGGSTPANVDAPASCPHVVGCGGTSKTAQAETVWNNDPGQTSGEGTGGGYSTVFPVQSFQVGAPPAPAGTRYGKGRMVPDVAADADPNTGYEIYVHGAATVIGGTSAVAPLYAGLFAAFGPKLGFVTPKLWANPGAFTDITSGGNGYYNAGAGPDPCSGLGAPMAGRIAALFAGA